MAVFQSVAPRRARRGCWTVSGDPAGLAEGVACCANAQTAKKITANHRSNRNELSPQLDTREFLDSSVPRILHKYVQARLCPSGVATLGGITP